MLTVTAYVDGGLLFPSFVFTGLVELQKMGYLRLLVRPRFISYDHAIDGFTTCFKVRDWRREAYFAVDLYDKSNVFSRKKLRDVDLYFKRNYIEAGIHDSQIGSLRSKVRPAGLSYSVRHTGLAGLYGRCLGSISQLSFMMEEQRKSLYQSLYTVVNDWRRYTRIQKQKAFELGPYKKVQRRVVFQTRAYEHINEDRQAISDQRAEVIRALKREFGSRFIGGFVPSSVARERYPDCISEHPVGQKEYLNLIKDSLVAVYTRGIRNSPAWKMGEYLAASTCIVAEKMETVLPEPLVDGEQALFFETTDEAVEAVAGLLDNPSMAQDMRHAAHEYYHAYVKPSSRVQKMLMHALGG